MTVNVTNRRSILKWSIITVGALTFGLLAGWLHGNNGGLRGSIGNVSAPWLFVAIVPAWWAGSAMRGALQGTLTTFVALLGFYISLTASMYGHLGNIHGLLPSFERVINTNLIWFAAGLISGPVCGALAAIMGARLQQTWLGITIGALMVGEVIVVAAIQNVTLPIVHVGWAANDARVSSTEVLLGVLVIALATVRRYRVQR